MEKFRPIKYLYYSLILFLILGYIFTLSIDLIDIDTAQYAEISREMLQNNDFFHLRDNGKKYLDKPILTFWTIALSFQIFGISNFSFRLPSLIMLLISCYGIFKISQLKFEKLEISLISVIAYLAIPGTYTFSLNPTIDVYLNTYFILVHLFYYLGFKKNQNFYYLMYLFLGLAIITKGPIGIVVPMISIGGDLLFRRDWNRLLEMKLIPGLLITSIFPFFWSYLLWQDFNDFGPYFFLYLQSFGRFYMKMYDQGWNPLYFITTFSWMFLTFLPIFLFAIYKNFFNFIWLKNYIKNFNLKNSPELKNKDYTIEFWIFLYLLLISFSKYRMPQYSYWNIPASAIFISPYIYYYLYEGKLSFKSILMILPSILTIILLFIIPFVIIDFSYTYLLILLFFFSLLYIYYNYNNFAIGITILPIAFIFIANSLLVYPELLKYQPSSLMGRKIQELEPNQSTILSLGLPRSKRSYEFYSNRLIEFIFESDSLINLLKKDHTRLAILPEEFQILITNQFKNKINFEIIESYPYYKVATPKMSFLKKASREKVVQKLLLIKLKLSNEEPKEKDFFRK